MKAPFDIAADLDTPVSAYLKLAPFGPRFLLESVTGGEQISRYSFIGFGEMRSLRLEGDTLTIDGKAQPAPDTTQGILDAFRSFLAEAPIPGPEVEGLPFQGGMVGVAGYDIVRRFERVPSNKPDPIGYPEAAYVMPRSLLVFDHTTRRVAVLHDGTEDERQALRRDVLMALRGPVPSRGTASHFRSGGFSSPKPSLSKEEFMAGVEKAIWHIGEGDVFQLVLSNRFTGSCQLDPFAVYRALRLLNPSPYMYFMEFEDGLAVVGSSPEALVKLKGQTATLRPIAGTRPRGATRDLDIALEEELLADPKEAAEHVMLVDLARNDLGRVAVPGTVRVDPYRVIERYSHVMHIVSGVTGDIREGTDQFDLFAATFPAGTVVGAPKFRAMEIIEDLEPIHRGFYAGTVGYFGANGNMDQAIAIRTVTFANGEYAYQAGAGVVADSKPDFEHNEVLAKSGALLAALKLAEEGL